LQVESPLHLDADRELLWRVFENLLRNALIHSGQAGGIRILARKIEGEQIEVVISDTGPGIDEAQIKNIFEPFFRIDEARDRSSGGHGLGLAIAASAVRRHDGRISASNRKEGGLEVSVLLPLKQESGA